MAETVRIEADAYATLTEIAQTLHVSLTGALSQVIKSYQRDLFLNGLACDFAALRADERADEEAERAAWDTTNSDGLADE